MKCSKCNRDLQPDDQLKWECSSCHQFCRANLQMLEQIQTQRENGYTAVMVNCPFCGTVLDDGNEKIHWDCRVCGNQTIDTVKNYVRPQMFVEEAETEPESEDSANQSEFAWFDSNGEAMSAPPEEPPAKQKSFFADEAEKNEFLAETKSQTLGEEIPDSVFEDTFPVRKPKSTSTETLGQGANPFVEPPREPSGPAANPEPPPTAPPESSPPESIPAGGISSANPFVEPPREPSGPAANPEPPPTAPPESSPPESIPAGGISSANPFVEPPREPSGPAANPEPPPTAPPGNISQASMPTGADQASAVSSVNTVSSETSSGDTSDNPTETSASDSSESDLLRYEPPEPVSKQVLPKMLTGILGVMIVAAIIVGVFFGVNFFLSPTRQFRSAVKAADYTKALEIYDSKMKGDTDQERIAQIAVEHFLHERYDSFKNGTGDKSAYQEILEFAQNKMGMNTSNYELDTEPTATPEPTETPEPTDTPPVEVTLEPDVTSEPAAEETAAPDATPEPTPEEPKGGDTQSAGSDDEIAAAIQKANNYVRKEKYEKAYNHLAKYKDVDTTGQIAQEISSIKKEWKSHNIKTFKALCDKLTIVYYASEKQYHIVPKGYYTNYNQISRSNNVGGIAYMDENKKKVSITNIGEDSALSSFGKTNRANLKQFKEMIEKYPYLAEEI